METELQANIGQSLQNMCFELAGTILDTIMSY